MGGWIFPNREVGVTSWLPTHIVSYFGKRRIRYEEVILMDGEITIKDKLAKEISEEQAAKLLVAVELLKSGGDVTLYSEKFLAKEE